MSLLPNAVGRLDNVVEAIRDGDHKRTIQLLSAERDRLLKKSKIQYLEQGKTKFARWSIEGFVNNITNNKDRWHEARKACGWSGNDSHDLPVEDFPIGGMIENWEIAEIVDNECCIISREGSVSPFWVPVEFLQCVGVRFDLPKGCDQK